MEDMENNPLTPPSPHGERGRVRGIVDFGIRIVEFFQILNPQSAIRIMMQGLL